MEDAKPAALASVLIDLSQMDDPQPSPNTPAATTAIDLTRDADWINLVDNNEQPSHKKCLSSNDGFNNKFHSRKKRKTTVSVLECSICLETVDAFQGYPLKQCGHNYCRACLHGYIRTKLSEKQVSNIVCPDTKCDSKLDTSDVRACTLEIGDAKSWRSFQEVATERFLDTAAAAAAAGNKDSSSIRRCPTNHCNFTFQYESSTGNPAQQGQLFICPSCEEAYCLECPVVNGKVGPAHDDTCYHVMEEIRKSEERQRKLEEWKRENAQADARFQELLHKEGTAGRTRPCPKCKTPITKNGGCDHMHCANCRTSFNWSSTRGTW